MGEVIDWQALTPEQRDRLIAEKLMNWQEKTCDGEWAEQGGGWFCLNCGLIGNWGDWFEHVERPPFYATSLDGAWQLAERYDKFEVKKCVVADTSILKIVQWSCNITRGVDAAIAFAATPQDAICLAALMLEGYTIKPALDG